MPVEQKVLARVSGIARYDWWLDNADLSNGGGDLGIFGGFSQGVGHQPEGLDVSDGDAHGRILKALFHQLDGVFARHGQTCAPACIRSARLRGRVSSPSARKSVTKFWSTKSFRTASVTKISRSRVVPAFLISRRFRSTSSRYARTSAFEDRGRSRLFPFSLIPFPLRRLCSIKRLAAINLRPRKSLFS